MKILGFLLFLLSTGFLFVNNYYQEYLLLADVASQALELLSLIYVIFYLFHIAQYSISHYLTALSKKTKTQIDDIFFQVFTSSLGVVKYLATFYIALLFIPLPETLELILKQLSEVSLLIVLLLFFTNFINAAFNDTLIAKSKMKSTSKTLMPFVRKTIIVILWIMGGITVISNLGYDVSALIAGAGVTGIAVALAAQNSISNIFGAITILMNRPFQIGDYVTINGHMGTVREIGLTYITLTDREGHDVMIPNGNIISTSIENNSQRSYRRADFSIGLIYDTSFDQMKKGVSIIEKILEKYVEEEKLQSYRVNFDTFGDFSLNIMITYYSNTFNYTEFVKEKEIINLEIKKLFAKSKLEMAFPTSEMIIKNSEVLTKS